MGYFQVSKVHVYHAHTHTTMQACMLTNRKSNSMHPSIEPTSASICLIELLKTCLDQPELNSLVKVASECLTIDFAKRPTAEEVMGIH